MGDNVFGYFNFLFGFTLFERVFFLAFKTSIMEVELEMFKFLLDVTDSEMTGFSVFLFLNYPQ